MIRLFLRFLLLGFSLLIVNQSFCQSIEIVKTDSLSYIPNAFIPEYQKEAKNRFFEINRFISEPSFLLEWSEALEVLEKEIELNVAYFDSLDTKILTTETLQRLDEKWIDIEKRLMVISAPLSVNTDKYVKLNEELKQIYNLWLETEINIKNTAIPGHLKKNVNDIKVEARALRNEVKNIEGDYLLLKSDCNLLISEVSTYRKLIADVRDKIVRNLLIAEQPPINKSFIAFLNDSVPASDNNRIEKVSDTVLVFFEKEPSVIYVAFFALILFYIILISLRRKLRIKQLIVKIPQAPGSIIILKKPILFSLMLTWMFVSLIYYFPVEIRSLTQLVMLIPILILLRNFYGKKQTLTMAIFSLFYLFKSLVFLLNSQSFIVRCIYIGIAIVLLLLLWYVLNSKTILDQFNKWTWFIKILLYVIFVIIASSLLFLILGNVLLGTMLIQGVIGIAITGMVLYAIFEMLNSMFQILSIVPLFQKSNIVFNHSPLLNNYIRNILGLGFFISWLNISLNNFAIKNEVVEVFLRIYTHQYHIGTTSFGINNLMAFILAIYISIWISQIIVFVLEEEVFTRRSFDKGRSGTIKILLRYSIITFGFMFALAAAGIELQKISLIIGALGVGIGFGLQSIFNNLVSGIVLALERPIKVDDIIEVGDLTGIVKNIGFRASRVRTYDGAEVIVPNGDLVSNQMINWTLSDRKRRLKINVGVSYDSDPDVVIEILKEVAESHVDVEKVPEPRPRFLGFGESSLDFQLLFWISDYENGFSIETDMILNLYKKLKDKGIEIPYPKRDIRIVKD
jgi:small-conductance mechanosensitive channel